MFNQFRSFFMLSACASSLEEYDAAVAMSVKCSQMASEAMRPE